jgi:hypothetical protein
MRILYILPLLLLSLVIEAIQCKPILGTTKIQCFSKLPYCQSIGYIMKFTNPFACPFEGSTKYRGDSGCQCKNYCGYLCKDSCNANRPLCTWNSNLGACFLY